VPLSLPCVRFLALFHFVSIATLAENFCNTLAFCCASRLTLVQQGCEQCQYERKSIKQCMDRKHQCCVHICAVHAFHPDWLSPSSRGCSQSIQVEKVIVTVQQSNKNVAEDVGVIRHSAQ
jgi:hypothetical protein